MREFDTTGFVNFPSSPVHYNRLEIGKTYVYLVAIDFNSKEFSNLNLDLKGDFNGDDITPKKSINTDKMSIDQLVKSIKEDNPIEFDIEDNKILTSSVLIGWSSFSYKLKNDINPWVCSFRELTNEGKKLYYSLKKLHYDKDIRLLTFNNI